MILAGVTSLKAPIFFSLNGPQDLATRHFIRSIDFFSLLDYIELMTNIAHVINTELMLDDTKNTDLDRRINTIDIRAVQIEFPSSTISSFQRDDREVGNDLVANDGRDMQ